MIVYVVNKGFDCEGEDTHSVHATPRSAWDAVRALIRRDYDESDVARLDDKDLDQPGELEIGGTSFHVREFEVKP